MRIKHRAFECWATPAISCLPDATSFGNSTPAFVSLRSGAILSQVYEPVLYAGYSQAEFEPLWAEYRYSFCADFGLLLPQLGHETEARALVADLTRDDKRLPPSVFYTYYGLRDDPIALEWLRRSIDDRSLLAHFVRLPNAFPGLQDQPGYADVVAHLDSLLVSP